MKIRVDSNNTNFEDDYVRDAVSIMLHQNGSFQGSVNPIIEGDFSDI